jgi:arylsulfatase A-like enzyme
MDRRQFLAKLGASALALPALLNAGKNKIEKEQKRNVVVIVSDDHAEKALGCYGSQEANTPNLDQMAQEGLKFTKAYCNAPICSASRQSLLTGKYPHATGVTLLFTPFNDKKNYTIAEHLRNNDYKTGLIGKTHWNNWRWWKYYDEGGGFPDHGFDYIIGKNEYEEKLKKNPPQKVPAKIKTYQDQKNKKTTAAKWNAETLPTNKYYQDTEGAYFSEKAIEFMKENKDDNFFLWLAYHEPHAPFTFPVGYRDKYDPADINLPEGSPEDDRYIPEIFRGLTEGEKKGIIASYYSSSEFMDKNIGKVLQAIKDLNLDENTMVIYISDNGYMLYDHKRFEKHMMWEEAVKSPMIIKGYQKNKTTAALTGFIDIAPTICEAVGVDSPESFQGKSFLPVVKGRQKEYKDYVFAEYLEDNKAMVASKNWKYIFTTGKRDLGLQYATGYGPTGLEERLYNLKKDPDESHDVSGKQENQNKLKFLRRKMLEIFMGTHPDAENVPPKLNTIGKLIWFCEPRDVGDEPGQGLKRIFEAEVEK